MKDEQGLRFLLDDDKKAANFIYRSPSPATLKAQKATLAVKFAQNVYFLDPWGIMLIGRSRLGRILFKLRHPYAYSKRWLWKLKNRIRRIFIKDRPIQCRLRNGKNEQL
jgi:hypothetical protein